MHGPNFELSGQISKCCGDRSAISEGLRNFREFGLYTFPCSDKAGPTCKWQKILTALCVNQCSSTTAKQHQHRSAQQGLPHGSSLLLPAAAVCNRPNHVPPIIPTVHLKLHNKVLSSFPVTAKFSNLRNVSRSRKCCDSCQVHAPLWVSYSINNKVPHTCSAWWNLDQ